MSKKIHVKNAFWAFNKKRGWWFLSDCYGPAIQLEGREYIKTPTGLVLVNVKYCTEGGTQHTYDESSTCFDCGTTNPA